MHLDAPAGRLAAGPLRLRAAAVALARVHPAAVLAPIVGLQLVLAVAVALVVEHNGWLWYHGGDATEYWSEQWAVAHGYMPYALVGYALPLAFGWVPALFGDTLLEGAPAIVLVQTGILLPLSTVLVYLVACRIGGRLLGHLAAAAWVAVPFLGIRMFRPSLREEITTLFLPHVFGLVDMADFASVVAVLAVTWAAFRALDDGRRSDAVLAGLLMGLAIAVKPANVLLLPAPLIAFAVARRWGHLLPFLVATAPSVLVLALWKQRGLGYLSVFALPDTGLAAGLPFVSLGDAPTYFDVDWSYLDANVAALREVFWSMRLLEYLPIAGTIAVALVSPAKAAYLAVWLVAFYLLKGTSPSAGVYATSFFRLTMPGFPALFLMTVALVLLVPTLARRAGRPRLPARPFRLTRGVAAAGALTVVAPLAVVALLRPLPPETLARNENQSTEAPVSDAFRIRAERDGDRVVVDWEPVATGATRAFYLVYRFPRGQWCAHFHYGASICRFWPPEPIGVTRGTVFREPAPEDDVEYRVILAANHRDEPAERGDLMLLSRAAVPQ